MTKFDLNVVVIIAITAVVIVIVTVITKNLKFAVRVTSNYYSEFNFMELLFIKMNFSLESLFYQM